MMDEIAAGISAAKRNSTKVENGLVTIDDNSVNTNNAARENGIDFNNNGEWFITMDNDTVSSNDR